MEEQENSRQNNRDVVGGKDFDEDGSLLKSLEQRLSSPRNTDKEDNRF